MCICLKVGDQVKKSLSVLQCREAENSRHVSLFNSLHTSFPLKSYEINSAEGKERKFLVLVSETFVYNNWFFLL